MDLLQGTLGIQIVIFDILLPNLFEFTFQILTLFFKAFEFNFEFKTALLSLRHEDLLRLHLLLHLLHLISLLIVLDFILSHRELKLLYFSRQLVRIGLRSLFHLGNLSITLIFDFFKIRLSRLHVSLVRIYENLLLLQCKFHSLALLR